MQRTRLYDCRISRLNTVVGLCKEDVAGIAGYVNSAQRRLLYAHEAGNDGWYGTFAEMIFNVTEETPYITLPREVARIMYASWCSQTVPVENQFYEYLTFGNGRLEPSVNRTCEAKVIVSRNNVVTFTDFTEGRDIRVRLTNDADLEKRVLIQGYDTNESRVYSDEVIGRVDGVFLTLNYPFVDTPQALSRLTGIQKDVTRGHVEIYDVDPDTGVETLLLTMEPSETTASYRRYYFNASTNETTQQLSAIVKLDLIPVTVDTDYLLIGNLEAIIEECSAIRYSEMDATNAKQMAAERHSQAIRLLNGELNHYLGSEQPAIGFRPFGRAKLENSRVGTLI